VTVEEAGSKTIFCYHCTRVEESQGEKAVGHYRYFD
jgi:hypothetical protein